MWLEAVNERRIASLRLSPDVDATRVDVEVDVEGFEPGPYALEVSSPGVERPLKRPEDFARRIGEKVRLRTHRPIDDARSHTGIIAAASEEDVTVATEMGERRVRFDDIASARTVFEWGPEKAPKKRSGK